ncbi:hypothetical protein KBD34_04485 [Patescibacteria group bacterium]|nr:hypothetical protein [Patescibacteria group bacterium]
MPDIARITLRAFLIALSALFVAFLGGAFGKVVGDLWGTHLVIGWYSGGEAIGTILAALSHAAFLWVGSLGVLHDRKRPLPPRWQLVIAGLATLLAILSIVVSPWRNPYASNHEVFLQFFISFIVIPWLVLSLGTYLLRPKKMTSTPSVSVES